LEEAELVPATAVKAQPRERICGRSVERHLCCGPLGISGKQFFQGEKRYALGRNEALVLDAVEGQLLVRYPGFEYEIHIGKYSTHICLIVYAKDQFHLN
jgi:hypothetical protein